MVGDWDSTRKQKKHQAGKILENAAESHQSAARFVGTLLILRLFTWKKYLLFYVEIENHVLIF